MTKDLNKLAKEIHEANKAKGFHEVRHSEEHMLCLVISELMEAVEADRKGRRADLKSFYNNGASERYLHNENYSEAFQLYIKDSVEDELADAVIRLLDTAGALDLYLDSQIYQWNFKDSLFTEKIYTILYVIYNYEISRGITMAIVQLGQLCKDMGIDLWKHVELKLKYNSLRPYKHGKTY